MAPVPVEAAFAEPPALYAARPVSASDGRNESLARLMLTALLAVDKTAEDTAESDEASEKDADAEVDEQEGATIPGAFVAVIFGVFGLLVIARRSQR